MNGVIYKLECKNKNITDIYIGHSNNEKKRKNEHKSAYNGSGNNQNCYVYNFIRENGGWENWELIIIETFLYEKSIAFQKEKEWYDRLQPTLNARSPNGRLISSSEKSKLWRQRNPNFVCECGVSISIGNKSRHLKNHL